MLNTSPLNFPIIPLYLQKEESQNRIVDVSLCKINLVT